MSRWIVMCARCDWMAVVDDMGDGVARSDAHEDVCNPVPVSALEDVGGAQ